MMWYNVIVITAFLIVLLGTIFLSQTADQVLPATTLTWSGVETIAIVMNTTGSINETATMEVTENPDNATWQTQGGCPLTSFVMENASGFDMTVTTDYIVNLTSGSFTMVNNTDTNSTGDYGITADNNTYVHYYYCADEYQTGFTNTVLGMIPGFFALAILVSIAFVIFWILRNEGIEL